jgi:hypothetical protein
MLLGQQPLRGRLGRIDPRIWVALAVAVVGLGSFPFWAGALGARLARSTLAGRLGVDVYIDAGRAGLGGLTLHDVRIAESGKATLAAIDRVYIPYRAVWSSARIEVEGARVDIERGGNGDNISVVLQKVSPREGGGGGAGGKSSGNKPTISLRGGTVRARDLRRGAAVAVEGLNVELVPDKDVVIETAAFAGIVRIRGGENDPKFGAGKLRMTVPLQGMRPLPAPTVEVAGGYVQPMANLGLTGIRGTVKPAAENATPPAPGAAPRPLVIALEGSYGGARESLWRATGQVKPPVDGHPLEMNVVLRAARFSLDRIREVLPPSVLDPKTTSVDAELDLGFGDGQLAFRGKLDVTGLNLQHEKLSSEPVRGMALGLVLDGRLDPLRRRLELAKFEGRMRNLVGSLKGAVELTPGTFKFTDGTEMPMVPKIEMRVQVPKIPCAKMLESIPGPIIPHLQGFLLKGNFEADIYTKIDYTDLDNLVLAGKVAIDGCQVLKAPDEVTDLAGPASLTQIVEIPSLDPKAPPGTSELLAFAIGPENPDFVPHDQISPYLISSILTTEDGGFFRHRGWVSPEFKTALRRNLQAGGFRLGASSITMQMVKNVLLSREKTMSRKLQELFLVWHIEKILPKERILELYFNAIEFGPRIYGIGTAAKHYFGKHASQLTPMEAAFFSSILPSPKRRYIQYCHGQLFPPWDKYVRRILFRVKERGRITEEEYTQAAAEPLQFDLTARTTSEPECMNWIKKITAKIPEPPPPDENLSAGPSEGPAPPAMGSARRRGATPTRK